MRAVHSCKSWFIIINVILFSLNYVGTVSYPNDTFPGQTYIVSKYNVGLKSLLLKGLSEPEFYGDLVHKFRKIIGKIDFPLHFKKIIVRYKKIGYNINVLRQTACLVVNPIKVNSFAYLFNCTTIGRTSD